jgi:hypothetical protein
MLSIRLDERGDVRVTVDIDESRREHTSPGINPALGGGLGLARREDPRDAITLDRDRAREGRGAGAVDDVCVNDEQVDHAPSVAGRKALVSV